MNDRHLDGWLGGKPMFQLHTVLDKHSWIKSLYLSNKTLTMELHPNQACWLEHPYVVIKQLLADPELALQFQCQNLFDSIYKVEYLYSGEQVKVTFLGESLLELDQVNELLTYLNAMKNCESCIELEEDDFESDPIDCYISDLDIELTLKTLEGYRLKFLTH